LPYKIGLRVVPLQRSWLGHQPLSVLTFLTLVLKGRKPSNNQKIMDSTFSVERFVRNEDCLCISYPKNEGVGTFFRTWNSDYNFEIKIKIFTQIVAVKDLTISFALVLISDLHLARRPL
jgi:hypothetical protein